MQSDANVANYKTRFLDATGSCQLGGRPVGQVVPI